MATKRDYYEVLGLPHTASEEDIKRAFRKLAFQYHPDRNQEAGTEDRFKEINEAYEVLSDPEKRANYDRWGTGEGAWGRGFEGVGFGGLGDIFDAFFGGMQARAERAPQRGADLRYELSLAFEEAAFGCEKEIDIQRTEVCSLCGGTGSRPGSQPALCPVCRGTGQVRHSQQSVFGRFVNIAPCQRCRGQGSVITDPCPQCRGAGRERQRRRLAVRVPAGVDDASQIRLRGEGEAGFYGGSPGDLYVVLSVQTHPLFRRDGDDLFYELPINLAQAALGDKVEIPTLNGGVALDIPAGTPFGKTFRLKGEGVPHVRGGGRGDLVVGVKVIIPTSLDEPQRRLLQELAKTLDKTTPSRAEPDRAGLLKRLKRRRRNGK